MSSGILSSPVGVNNTSCSSEANQQLNFMMGCLLGGKPKPNNILHQKVL